MNAIDYLSAILSFVGSSALIAAGFVYWRTRGELDSVRQAKADLLSMELEDKEPPRMVKVAEICSMCAGLGCAVDDCGVKCRACGGDGQRLRLVDREFAKSAGFEQGVGFVSRLDALVSTPIINRRGLVTGRLQQRQVVCDECKGLGSNGMVRCSACSGDGYRYHACEQSDPESIGDGLRRREEICSACDGLGSADEDWEESCAACDGDGYRWRVVAQGEESSALGDLISAHSIASFRLKQFERDSEALKAAGVSLVFDPGTGERVVRLPSGEDLRHQFEAEREARRKAEARVLELEARSWTLPIEGYEMVEEQVHQQELADGGIRRDAEIIFRPIKSPDKQYAKPNSENAVDSHAIGAGADGIRWDGDVHHVWAPQVYGGSGFFRGVASYYSGTSLGPLQFVDDGTGPSALQAFDDDLPPEADVCV